MPKIRLTPQALKIISMADVSGPPKYRAAPYGRTPPGRYLGPAKRKNTK